MSAHSEESALKDKELKAEHADDAPPTYAKDEYTAFQGLPPDPDAGCSEEEKAAIDKRLLRKLDWKLIPWLSLLYLMSFLDRELKWIFKNGNSWCRYKYWKCKDSWSYKQATSRYRFIGT